MDKSLDRKVPADLTKGLAEYLEIDEASANRLVIPHTEVVASIKEDPTFCAILGRVNLIAPYFFPEQPSAQLKQIGKALISTSREAANYTVTVESDESIEAKLIKFRAEYLAIKKLKPELAEDYLYNRIHLAICVYYFEMFGDPIPLEMNMALSREEKKELAKMTRIPSQHETNALSGIVDKLKGELDEAVAAHDAGEISELTRNGMHPIMAARIQKTKNDRFLKGIERQDYPTKEDLFDLVTNHQRLKALIDAAIPSED